VHLLVDRQGVVTVGVEIVESAAACRGLAAGLARIPDVSDSAVRAGIGEVADVCADVLELVAIDLDLVAMRVRAGAVLYSAVEGAAVAALAASRR
jgi:hypothetical protein